VPRIAGIIPTKTKIMVKLTIKITKEILERSKGCAAHESGKNCAIALAIRDIMPGAFVSNRYIFPMYYKKDHSNFAEIDLPSIDLPSIAINFISRFDAMLPEDRVFMEEIEFEVEIPDDFIQLIDISEVQKVLENHPTLTLINQYND
jgi:hypothetical protein